MVVKKRVVPATHAPLEEEAPSAEEKRPSVTQVVEVVEEVPQEEATPATQATPARPVTQEAQGSPVITENQEPLTQPQPAEEKRREVVDEIFQKDTSGESRVMPEISMHTKRRTPQIFLWAIGIIVACVVIGIALLFATGKSGNLPSVVVIPTPTSTPMPEVTPTSTPSGAITREGLTIQVLNGGGVSGAASKMKKFLEDKGYTVSGTGNTESYTYDNTEIHVKPEKKAYITLLEEDLEGEYTLGTSAATLDKSVSYDAQVIVGK
jgi:hypothetical protein